MLFAIVPEEITVRIIVGAIGLVLGAVLYPTLNERTVKRRLRKLCEENAGSDRVFLCQIELEESAIHTKQNGMEIIYPWVTVKEIRETNDSVDIYTQKGGCVVVRKRAFTRPGEQQQFIELANRYWKLADATLELTYQMQNYREASLKDLPQRGLSSEYVDRETRRALSGAGNTVKILSGIDIDIATNQGEKKTAPEDVRNAIQSALGAGAAGVILSRKYSEMRLANLRAAGEACQAFMRKRIG